MTVKAAVLITDTVHPILISGLTEQGFECHYQPDIDFENVNNIIQNYVGLIINSKITVDKKFLDKAVNLKFIARLGSGLEIIDLDYAETKGVKVHRSPEGNCDAVAEHAMGMLLTLANNICKSDRELRQGIWNRELRRGWELMGKTVGIIGFGYTGSAFAKRLSGFDCRILVYDKYKKGFQKDYPYIEETEMNLIFKESDVLSLHLPLTNETRKLVVENFINKFKKDFFLINTSRGEVIDTKDLLTALNSGKIKGACLDVFDNEKPKTYSAEEQILFNELFTKENVVLTPHIAGWTKESKERLSRILLDKIIRAYQF
jgi:D-3-phosphoglycerate dehydrogenase